MFALEEAKSKGVGCTAVCEGLRTTEGDSLCLAQVLQRQKGMKAMMMKMKVPRTITTMK